MISERNYSAIDKLLISACHALETVFQTPSASREYPATTEDDDSLTDSEKRQSGRYMRVNHVGEICAQALYQSQALTARNADIQQNMQHSAAEEIDHLAWCERRLDELNSRKSCLNPVWYAGSFAVGIVAGIAGDKWNLGFVAETENQVVAHLDGHLGRLPENDLRSRKIVSQMKIDEARHAEQAAQAGAENLPRPIKGLMKAASAVMTRTAHWI